MGYHFFDHGGAIGVTLSGRTLGSLFGHAAHAFTDTIVAIDGVEPRRPEEVEVAAPELDQLLVDFLSELLYRFDTRGWLTHTAEVVVQQADGGWVLEGTLRGEKLDRERHRVKTMITAVSYQRLEIRQHDAEWAGTVVFDIAHAKPLG